MFIFTAFTAITAFLTKVHHIHRISYKNLPKNLDPGTVDVDKQQRHNETATQEMPEHLKLISKQKKLEFERKKKGYLVLGRS